MTNPNKQLNIGDEIGFVQLSNDVDSPDRVLFFPICEITTRDGERAYRYMYPDGEVSASAITESRLSNHVIRVNRKVEIKPQPDKSEMVCINDRTKEHLEALSRGENSKLQVFNDWDPNTYVVKNQTNGKEYRINFLAEGTLVFAQCECADFTYRHRVCKHISAVMHDALLAIFAKSL